MTEKPQSEQSLDSRLDEALALTFPASDPIEVHSPAPSPPRLSEGSPLHAPAVRTLVNL